VNLPYKTTGAIIQDSSFISLQMIYGDITVKGQDLISSTVSWKLMTRGLHLMTQK
jgi:hypothetical protein